MHCRKKYTCDPISLDLWIIAFEQDISSITASCLTTFSAIYAEIIHPYMRRIEMTYFLSILWWFSLVKTTISGLDSSFVSRSDVDSCWTILFRSSTPKRIPTRAEKPEHPRGMKYILLNQSSQSFCDTIDRVRMRSPKNTSKKIMKIVLMFFYCWISFCSFCYPWSSKCRVRKKSNMNDSPTNAKEIASKNWPVRKILISYVKKLRMN